MDITWTPPALPHRRLHPVVPARRAASLWDRAPQSTWYLILLGLAMATGTVVLIEPAPIDLAVIVLLVCGLALGKLGFARVHELPLVLLAGFLAANLLSIPGAIDRSEALRYFAITAYLAASWVFFAGVVSRQGYRAVRILMNGYAVAGVLSAILGVLSYLGFIGHQDLLLRYGRPQGLFKDPNVFGPYMIPMLTWAVMRLQAGARGLAWLWWLGVSASAVAGVFFSYSRAAWIGCVVTLAAYFGLQIAAGGWTMRKIAGFAGILAALMGLGLAVGVVISSDAQVGRMLRLRLGADGLQTYDYQQRFYTQRLAIRTVQERPFGLGPGQAEVDFTVATHSMYLRPLVENGVVGFLTLIGLVIFSVLRSLRLALQTADPQWRALFTVVAACLVGLLVNGAVIDTIHWRHMWLLLGLAWASHSAMYANPRRRAAAGRA
jgi:O-antigen ligase